MAKRLNDSQKSNLVEAYRSGESTIAIAKTYGCSQNTVIRIVKALIPSKEYIALKTARFKGELLQSSMVGEKTNCIENKKSLLTEDIVQKDISNESNLNSFKKFSDLSEIEDENQIDMPKSLVFSQGDDPLPVKGLKPKSEEPNLIDVFQEVVPLTSEVEVIEPKEMSCKKLGPGVLPSVVYMLVDRAIELDARPLREFSELDSLPKMELDRYAICLFSNQRSAKRSCGRSQRVIKVPDSNVFSISKPFLLARGISRLLLDNVLIALDEEVSTTSRSDS